MKIIAGLCALVMSVTAIAQELKPTKSGLFDVGGFKLYLTCYENDKPTLIIEQGFGCSGSDGVWLDNVKRLHSDFSICLYDRAGLGKSEKGPVPFTVTDMATRLNALLHNANVKPPYYFAGGSYASYIITAFNNQYADKVKGAVFIDPPPFGYFYTMATRWPKNFKTDDENLARYYQFEQSVRDPMYKKVPENVDHIASYQSLVKSDGFANKPIIVLRAKASDERYDPPFVPDEIALKMDTLYAGAEHDFLRLSSQSAIVYSKSNKHHLHIADADLVVKSIKQLLE
ncbi:alpha/beta fold hydrolase [Pseudoalteromonas sp. XMcav1-K]|uniref:alpha/beta fold hydrolase n=1 Tax=Pseudoalteromonas sp. XMcav1-K TaxID=3374372 RepID=UPI003757B255